MSILNYLKMIFNTTIGGMDSIIYALILFIIIDYITGVLLAIKEKKLSSYIGYKGICKKVVIFILIAFGNIFDKYIIGSGNMVKTLIVLFYLSNEGISILENAEKIGVAVPKKLKSIVKQLKNTKK